MSGWERGIGLIESIRTLPKSLFGCKLRIATLGPVIFRSWWVDIIRICTGYAASLTMTHLCHSRRLTLLLEIVLDPDPRSYGW